MENNNSSGDRVWISREEYDRLRDTSQQTAITTTQASNSDSEVTSENTWGSAVMAMLAAALLLIFTIPLGAFIQVPIVIIFLVLAFNGVIRLPFQHKAQTGSQFHKKRTAGQIILLILAALILVPVLAFIGLIIFFMLIFSVGGGRGS